MNPMLNSANDTAGITNVPHASCVVGPQYRDQRGRRHHRQLLQVKKAVY